jgi:hypothetical protein
VHSNLKGDSPPNFKQIRPADGFFKNFPIKSVEKRDLEINISNKVITKNTKLYDKFLILLELAIRFERMTGLRAISD